MNELEYISWKEFKKIAPSVVKLEINRIGKLLQTPEPGSASYNSLIKTRFELNQFHECLEKNQNPPLPDSCVNCLRNAIFSLSLESKDSEGHIAETIHDILDRLKYVYNRIGMIY